MGARGWIIGRYLSEKLWLGPLLVALLLLPLYLATNSDGRPQNRDTVSSAIPAWRLATHGDLTVTEFKEPWLTATNPAGTRRQDWYVESGGRITSNRPPGAIFWAVPFYWLSGASPDEFTLGPASVAASVAVALSVAAFVAVFQSVVDPKNAFLAGLVVGVGTPLWGVASDALWQHSVSVLFLAVGLWFLARQGLAGAGLASGFALLARPLAGTIAAVWGIYLSVRQRSWKPVVVIGFTSAIGFGILLWYYQLAYQSLSLTGGYGSYPTAGLVGRPLFWYFENIWNVLFSSDRGIFLYTPFLLVLVPGLRAAWAVAPDWVKGGALSGVVYMLLQLRVNSYSGGGVWVSYRLPLEMLAVSAPLLLLSYREWVSKNAFRVRLFQVALILSVGVQLTAALRFVS